jgi:epidermal growth factor receptor substrate 15
MINEFSLESIVGDHQIIYDLLFSQADASNSGYINALDSLAFLRKSKLKEETLKIIYDLSDPVGKGYLDRQSFYIILKLVAIAQSENTISMESINIDTPPPNLGELNSNITTLIAVNDPWYIKASKRIEYDKLFESLSPINNKISGDRVKPFLIKSDLQVDVLGKIWELSDLDLDGQLDRDEFFIAMQLVNKAKLGAIIPDKLPPSLFPFKTKHSMINTSSSIINNMNSPNSVGEALECKPWIVTYEEKSRSDITFNELDLDKDGFILGTEVREVFLKSGLSQMILANIWLI